MLVFPIDRHPIVDWEDSREDNLVTSSVDAGYEITRPRNSRVIKKFGPFVWQHLNETEQEQLMNFFDVTTGSGSLPFLFIYYTRSGSHTIEVRFDGVPKCQYIGYGKYLVTCSFKEV